MEDLRSTWNTIYDEFLDGTQDAQGVYRMRLFNRINKLSFDYELIQLIVKRLSLGPSQEALDILRKHIRVTGTFDPEDMEQYFKDLQVVLNISVRMQQEIEEKSAEYAILNKGKEEKITKKHFDSLIAKLSKFAHFHINKQVVTVGEFIALYSEMRTHEESLRSQLEKNKR